MRYVRLLAAVLFAALTLVSRAGLAQITFDTGEILGAVTQSDNTPVPGVQIRANSLSSSGSIWSTTDATGAYAMTQIPAGDYRVEARYEHGLLLGSQDVTVVAGQQVTADFTFLGANLSWTVIADGAPAVNAQVQIIEQAPASCSEADFCHWQQTDPDGEHCDCELGGRHFWCNPMEGCMWMDMPGQYDVWTDAAGTASRLLPAGTYKVTAFSAQPDTMEPEGGQWGSVAVATTTVTVTDLADVVLPNAVYETGVADGLVTLNGNPLANARLEARPAGGTGYTGQVWAQSDATGLYSLILPAGAYDLRLFVDQELVETQPATVVAAQSVSTSFAIVGDTPGQLTGLVEQDGGPDIHARIEVEERAPTCSAADFCHYYDITPEGDFCDCELDGRFFMCDPHMGCMWMDMPRHYDVATDNNGAYALELPAGDYHVRVRSQIGADGMADPTCDPMSPPEMCTSEPSNSHGSIVVESFDITVPSGMTVDAGLTSYQTGTISGTLTNCGAATSDLRVRVGSPFGGAEAWADATGAYSIRLPAGGYTVRAEWDHNVYFASSNVTVVASGDVPFSADGDNGQLRGIILQNGEQAAGASVQIEEKAPTCSEASFCHYYDITPEGDFCDCELDGRFFMCDPHMGCMWMDMPIHRQATTGVDGTFTVSLPPGGYTVRALSPSTDGQHGGVVVGVLDATVQACALVSIGASSTSVDPGTNVVADLGDNITIDFAAIDATGEVSFTATSTPPAEAPPSIEFAGLFYDITVDATFSGTAEICLPYDAELISDPSELVVMHYENDVWVDITTSVDTVAQVVCGETTSFSPFVVGRLLGPGLVANAGDAIEAVAGPDCHSTITLDGSASTGTIVAYDWYHEGTLLGSGATLPVAFERGHYVVELVVTSSTGATASAAVPVTVRDNTPPTLAVSLDRSLLWPPNGKMQSITPAYALSDNCDGAVDVTLTDLVGTAGDASDVSIDDPAAGLFSVRAFRRGSEKEGRTYTATYEAIDAAGNPTVVSAEVYVPHDQRK